jgi:hypothetical protein
MPRCVLWFPDQVFKGAARLMAHVSGCAPDQATLPDQVFKALRGGVQVVAVKVLHDAEGGGLSFVREIAILKGCRHSNIVQFQARVLPVCLPDQAAHMQNSRH